MFDDKIINEFIRVLPNTEVSDKQHSGLLAGLVEQAHAESDVMMRATLLEQISNLGDVLICAALVASLLTGHWFSCRICT